ncbi:MAG TPA: hypothetical protein VG842_03065 [Sediminibacterium sp.]|nr:hypothetical protein [Sediminibacterium sp.]
MPVLKHQISLADAVAMTTLYRQNRPAGYPICETFDAGSIQALLAQQGAVGFRIYYGLKPDLTMHAILVAADAGGADILPATDQLNAVLSGDGDQGLILEDSDQCPEICPPDSPLNA